MLVLDDANEPTCRELVLSLNDARIRYIPNPRALGPALNHARGISEARGEYIALVNHDDVLDSEAIEIFVQALAATPGAVATFSRPRVIRSDGTEDSVRTESAWRTWNLTDIPSGVIEDWTRLGVRLGFPINPSALFRARVIKSVHIPRAVGGSYDFWVSYRTARLGAVIHEPSALGYWREHDDNLTIVRSSSRTFERVYLDARLSLDGRLPPRERFRALGRLPRSLAAWLRDLVVGRRRTSNSSAVRR